VPSSRGSDRGVVLLGHLNTGEVHTAVWRLGDRSICSEFQFKNPREFLKIFVLFFFVVSCIKHGYHIRNDKMFKPTSYMSYWINSKYVKLSRIRSSVI
jgi:hypothetical protein